MFPFLSTIGQPELRTDVATVTISGTTSGLPGDSFRLTAVCKDADGFELQKNVSWATTNPAIALVDNSGLVTLLQPGEVAVVARVDRAGDFEIAGSATLLTVNDPSAPAFAHGDTLAFDATSKRFVPTSIAGSITPTVNAARPAAGRSVVSLAQYLLNNASLNVKDFGATGDGTTDDTVAVYAAMNAAATAGIKRVYFPTGSYKLTSAFSCTGNDGYHGLMLTGDGGQSSKILKRFNGDLFTLTAVLNLTVENLGFDGGYTQGHTGRCFDLTGACNYPIFAQNHFVGFSSDHIRLGINTGYYSRFIGNQHFSGVSGAGVGQPDFCAIRQSGQDTTATPRIFVGVGSNGYFHFDGAYDTHIIGCFATRFEILNGCSETMISGSVWADQQNFLANIPISIGGVTTLVTGCRIANSVVLISGSSGAFVGNKQSGVLAGTEPVVDSTGGDWMVLHFALGKDYHYLGRAKFNNKSQGEINIDLPSYIGDTDYTYEPAAGAVGTTLIYASVMAANRSLTLSNTNARVGMKVTVVHKPSASAFHLTIFSNGQVLQQGQRAVLMFNGSYWDVVDSNTMLA